MPRSQREIVQSARQQAQAARDAASASPGAAWPTPAPLPADAIPGYSIVGELHRGGQGVVYRAAETASGRAVAIKVLREGVFSGPRDRMRFEREVQILEQLNHPGIVRVRASGVASGAYYFVMDCISGAPLDDYWETAPLDIEGALALFRKVCRAAHAAHRSGVIHRDLKPSNILVDSAGEPHVLDFGLAKLEGARPDESMTATGQFVGSLPWASPEQVDPRLGSLDTRTDVYSLGVILYQMLTGGFPYDVLGGLRDALTSVLDAAPVAPRALRPEIDEDLEAIMLQCLNKDREQRYDNAGELLRDLERHAGGEPVAARGDNDWYVLSRTLRHNRVPVVTAAALLLDSVLHEERPQAPARTPRQGASGVGILAGAGGLLGGLTVLGMATVAFNAGSLAAFLLDAFDVLIAAAYLFPMVAVVGAILIGPSNPLTRAAIRGLSRAALFRLALAGAVLLGAGVALSLLVEGALSSLVTALWIAGPAVTVLRGVEQAMARHESDKLRRWARNLARAAILFGLATFAVYTLRPMALSDENYAGPLLALTLITLAGGLAIGALSLRLMLSAQRVLDRAGA